MRLGWVRSGKAWILIVFTRKHQGTSECAAGGLCLHLKIKKKKFQKFCAQRCWLYRMAGENFLSTEISKFVNVEFQKTSAKVANSKCEKNIREHHNELQEACVWILKPKK